MRPVLTNIAAVALVYERVAGMRLIVAFVERNALSQRLRYTVLLDVGVSNFVFVLCAQRCTQQYAGQSIDQSI